MQRTITPTSTETAQKQGLSRRAVDTYGRTSACSLWNRECPYHDDLYTKG